MPRTQCRLSKGQGANQALLDAVQLADALAIADFDSPAAAAALVRGKASAGRDAGMHAPFRRTRSICHPGKTHNHRGPVETAFWNRRRVSESLTHSLTHRWNMDARKYALRVHMCTLKMGHLGHASKGHTVTPESTTWAGGFDTLWRCQARATTMKGRAAAVASPVAVVVLVAFAAFVAIPSRPAAAPSHSATLPSGAMRTAA